MLRSNLATSKQMKTVNLTLPIGYYSDADVAALSCLLLG